LQYGNHMTVKTTKRGGKRVRVDMKEFLVYLPPAYFKDMNKLWLKMGHANRAELCRQVLKDYIDANRHLIEKKKSDEAVESIAS
jgi:hypothetical protein